MVNWGMLIDDLALPLKDAAEVRAFREAFPAPPAEGVRALWEDRFLEALALEWFALRQGLLEAKGEALVLAKLTQVLRPIRPDLGCNQPSTSTRSTRPPTSAQAASTSSLTPGWPGNTGATSRRTPSWIRWTLARMSDRASHT